MLAIGWSGTASAATTIVSLEFDHPLKYQYALRDTLNAHGMKATFFVNSGHVGSNTGFMTWDELRALYADGHEIGGHTATHADPDTLSPEGQRDEVCVDRQALLDQGFAATSFSYPKGSDDISEAVVQGCGYNSGRDLGGLRGLESCFSCPMAEEVPPRNRYRTRSSQGFDNTTELETLQGYVTRAEESGGGWVQLVWTCYCTVTPEQIAPFLSWLQARQASHGTVVQTVQQVISGSLQPAPLSTGSPLPEPPPGSGLQVASGDTIPPLVARLGLTRRSFTVGRETTPLLARSRPRSRPGTVFRYVVSEPGSVVFRIDRLLPGRRVGRSCQRPTRRLRRAPRCTRSVTMGRLTRATPRLANRTRFSGRIGRTPLRPGKYMLLATAVDTAGNISTRARRARFTVVRRATR